MQYQNSQHEWSIELLRGIAALMVVFAHYYPLAGIEPGLLKFFFSGVDLFFVISGFVFAPYLFGKQFAVVPFMIRRIFRIYPLYLAALFAYIALHLYQNLAIEHIAAHLFFLHTLESKAIAFYYNPAFWSLPPEVEFYLFLPLWLLIVNRIRHYAIIFPIALIAHLVIAFLSPANAGEINFWAILAIHLPGMLIEFLLGAIVWRVITQSKNLSLRLILLLIGFIFWITLAQIFSSRGDGVIASDPILRGNMGLFAALTYSIILCGWIGLIKQCPQWLRQCSIILGNLSYGIYLFHNAMPIALQKLSSHISDTSFAVICFVCTLLIATLAHIVVEAPLRKLGRQWAANIQTSSAQK